MKTFEMWNADLGLILCYFATLSRKKWRYAFQVASRPARKYRYTTSSLDVDIDRIRLSSVMFTQIIIHQIEFGCRLCSFLPETKCIQEMGLCGEKEGNGKREWKEEKEVRNEG